MQHEVLPPIIKRTLALAYALSALALCVLAPEADSLEISIACVVGAILLFVAAILAFVESNTAQPKPHIMSGPELVKAQAAQQAEVKPAPASETATKPEPEVVPVAESTPEPEPTPEPVKAQSSSPAQAPQKPTSNETCNTLRLRLLRSQDVQATLRELITHGEDETLATALIATGITKLDDFPAFECSYLKRSNRFWFQFEALAPHQADYDVLSSAEAVLNTYQDALILQSDSDDVRVRMLQVFEGVPRLVYDAESKWLRTKAAANMSGEWGTRLRFAQYCENLGLPFRFTFDFDTNLRDESFTISAVTPRPSCFAFLGFDAEACAQAARTYALDLAELLAQGAFDTNEQINHVQVLLHEYDAPEIRLALLIHREDIAGSRIASFCGNDLESLLEQGLVLAELDDDGWFAPLAGDYDRLAVMLERPDRWTPAELKRGRGSEELTRACGTNIFSNLGINESAARREAWTDLETSVDNKLSTTVSHLVALRDKTDDLTVAEAANRLADALVRDAVDITNTDEMRKIFISGDSLSRAVELGRKALESQDESAMETAIARLETELAPLMETGLYLDDELHVYRYFNSSAERILYNLEVDDGARSVRLVPDAYYNAHSCALRLHAALGNVELAFEHADEMCRMAPVTTDCALARIRLFEDNGQIVEAESLLKELIEHAPTVFDLSLAFYRLAYMEWKLGRTDLSVACYERAIELYPGTTTQALPELNDLLKSEPELERLNASQVKDVLTKGGLPYGDSQAIQERLFEAARVTTDEELFPVARQLLGTFADSYRDDVTFDIYRSLKPVS